MLVTTGHGAARSWMGFARLPASAVSRNSSNRPSGFPALDMKLLEKVLERYDLATLWAATGWFLEQLSQDFPPAGETTGTVRATSACIAALPCTKGTGRNALRATVEPLSAHSRHGGRADER